MNDSSLQTVKPSALALALEGARVTPGSRYRTCSWYLLLKTSFLLLFRQKVLGYKYMNFSLLSERSALEKEGKDVKNVVAMLSSLCNTWVVHLNWSHVVISFMKLMQCCRSLSVLLWILFFLRVFKGPKFLSLSYPSLTRCWINIIMETCEIPVLKVSHMCPLPVVFRTTDSTILLRQKFKPIFSAENHW